MQAQEIEKAIEKNKDRVIWQKCRRGRWNILFRGGKWVISPIRVTFIERTNGVWEIDDSLPVDHDLVCEIFGG